MQTHPMIIRWLSYSVFFCFFSFVIHAQELAVTDVSKNTMKVDEIYQQDPESIDYATVISLSQDVIKFRELYNINTLAKVFALLAEAATNKGDVAKALQFAQDGAELIGVEQQIYVKLLLKVAAGHYYKGKYNRTEEVADQAVAIARKIDDKELLIYALSYRAMANALIAKHDNALSDIETVEQLLTVQPTLSDSVLLINLLASAHYYLGDHATAITLYNKILKLRFELSKTVNIDSTYYNLARSYLASGALDDAYNAFWEALTFAKKKAAPIRIAYAQLGLGKVYFLQNNYQKALDLFNLAERGFHGYNLTQPYLSVLIDLAQVHLQLNNQTIAYQYLHQAKDIAVSTELTEQQIILHLLLAKMYKNQGQLTKALDEYFNYAEKSKQFDYSLRIQEASHAETLTSQKRRNFSLKFANQSTLSQEYQTKYQQQRQLISILVVILVALVFVVFWLSFKLRSLKLNHAYEQVEKPLDYIAGPSISKKLYQYHYKMARKYQYPLTVGYFTIENWDELTFQFNKKIVEEVSSALAMLINETKNEFVQVGVINFGEYLFLAPHQQPEELTQNLSKLAESIKLQFFANLGEFSLKVRYDCQSPSVQDIDPYIFLSRISDSAIPETSRNKF